MTAGLPPRLLETLAMVRRAHGEIVVLTGAGISAESGIPTFRGADGFWRAGSVHYQPEELATFAAFARMPAVLWGWYLYRRRMCTVAQPNAAHRALVDLERAVGDRFVLATQNVDGLHLRAGHDPERVFEVHGSLHRMRCMAECSPPQPIPLALGADWPKDHVPEDEASLLLLHCERCGAWLRPHVLWFDEYYDEEYYRYESAQRAVADAALLLVIGTSGATNLPTRMVELAHERDIPLVVVNLDPSPYSDLAQRTAQGAFVQGTATERVPEIVRALIG
jgi:NAD-dependent deacetylase